MVCLGNICINTLHKGAKDDDDDDDDDNNNNNNRSRSRNGLKQGDALSPLLFNFASEYAIRRVKVHQMACN
jgi:hypothetical protein